MTGGDSGGGGGQDSSTIQPTTDGGGGPDTSVPQHPVDSGPVPPYDATPNFPDTAIPCVTPSSYATSLPFAVDQYFSAGGWMQPSLIAATPTCAPPAGADAGAGKCWGFIYSPPDASSAWAGVDWQAPSGNWGSAPGLGVPSGATKVTFRAWGATGTESVTFNVGYGPSSPDAFGGSLKNQQLSTTPTQYSISLAGDNYACNSIRMGFGWSTAGATPMTFYIDSITWQ